MATKKRKAPKRRNVAAKALARPAFRQRKVPDMVKKSRGRKRMNEIYAREWRCVESEEMNDRM